MKATTIIYLSLALLLSASCSQKKPQDDLVIIHKPAAAKQSKPQKTGDYEKTQTVNWLGERYTLAQKLAAVDSLPLATDGVNRYYDNRWTLRIIRADGSEFFSRSFGKRDFKQWVDNTYYKNGALLGAVFEKVEGNSLVFAVSVGNPDKSSDEYAPLLLKVDKFGNVSISKDTRPDMDDMG